MRLKRLHFQKYIKMNYCTTPKSSSSMLVKEANTSSPLGGVSKRIQQWQVRWDRNLINWNIELRHCGKILFSYSTKKRIWIISALKYFSIQIFWILNNWNLHFLLILLCPHIQKWYYCLSCLSNYVALFALLWGHMMFRMLNDKLFPQINTTHKFLLQWYAF